MCARTGVIGAFMNVKINCADCKDESFVKDVISRGNAIQQKAEDLESEIRQLVEASFG